ncbi:putative SMCs flexible hinge superfamily [Helianthus anomalus]
MFCGVDKFCNSFLLYSDVAHFTPQVFARTVICRDLDVATRVSRTDGLDCITVEGD